MVHLCTYYMVHLYLLWFTCTYYMVHLYTLLAIGWVSVGFGLKRLRYIDHRAFKVSCIDVSCIDVSCGL